MPLGFGFGLQITQAADDTFYCRLSGGVHVHFFPAGLFQANVVAGLEVAPWVEEGGFVSGFVQIACCAGDNFRFFAGAVADDAQEAKNDFVIRRRADVG